MSRLREASNRRLNVGIVGATGMVGQQFISQLAEHPWFRPAWLAASERSEGRTYAEAAAWHLTEPPPTSIASMRVDACTPGRGPRLVFSGLDATAAKEIEPAFARAGHLVISNARNYRMDPSVPLLIPEINPDHLSLLPRQRREHAWPGAIVTNPNCSTVVLSMVLAPLRQFGLRAVNVTTLQAVSGAGYPGVASLDILGNVIPAISGEEEKMQSETQKILGTLDRDGLNVTPHLVVISAHTTRVGVIDGHTEMVSIKLDDAPPLEEALGVLPEHFKDFPLRDRHTQLLVRLKIRANWKAAQEAFLEAYHTVETHADGMAILGSSSTQIDAWSKGLGYISRLYTPVVVVDSYIASTVSARDGLDVYCTLNDLDEPPKNRGASLEDARLYAAEVQRERLEKDTKRDYSKVPVSYLVDAGKYHMFPAFHPWWGEGIPWWYNFTPLGDDPEQCVMEIRVLQPITASGVRQPPAPVINIDFGEEPDKHPILSKTFVGPILAQDLRNMEAVQQGFKAAAPANAYMTISRYQEAQITYFHEIYDRVMGLDVNSSR